MENKTSKVKTIIITAAGVLIAGVLATGAYYYIKTANQYKTVFFPGTVINNIDAGYKTPEEIKETIRSQVSDYSVRVLARDRDPETITAQQVDLHYVLDDAIDQLLASQEIYKWPYLSRKSKNHVVTSSIELDEDRFNKVCDDLKVFDDETAKKPVDAKLGDYDAAAHAYAIVPCADGNLFLKKEAGVALIKDAMLTLQPEVDLDPAGNDFYAKAEIRDDNESILKEKNKLDQFAGTQITYEGSDIVLDGAIISKWLEKDPAGNVSITKEEVAKWVGNTLAKEYDTVGKERKFTTAWGNEVSVSGGTYGWLVDQEAEVDTIMDLVPKKTVVVREPEYSQKGAVHTEPDWGDTYVEVNIKRQHMYCWVDGKVIVDSDLVSGTENASRYTPDGVYSVRYKQYGAVLRGPRTADGSYSYESPVTFWMPFNNGIGLHDATWRGSFGGDIYLHSGSHGCVNLPYKAAQTVYNNIEAGCPVIVYRADTPEMTVEPPRGEPKKAQEAQTPYKPKKSTSSAPAPQPEPVPETQPAAPEAPAPQPETQPQEVGPGFVTETAPAPQEVGPGV